MRRWWCVKEKKQKMALLLITFTMLLQLQIKGCVGCVESERIGLLELKSYLNSLYSPQDETFLNSWSDNDPTSDCCVWERVQCSDDIDGHIVDLSLGKLGIYTGAPQSLNLSLLHSFPQLQSLHFSENWFRNLFDPIHGYKSFQKLEKLRTLDLTSNRFNNSVLPFLSAAKSLRTLNLGSNNLEGVFPPKGLSNFRELEELDLSYNYIDSVQPGYKSFQSLEKLRVLDLSGNLLNNSVLPYLSAAKSLRTLNLGYNNLEGVFPPKEFANMTELKVLDLRRNKFSLFSDQGLMFLSSLQVLNLRENQLPLTLKDYLEICRLMDLRELDLGSNALTSMPYCLRNLTRLRTLDLSNNQLDGDLSSFVSSLPSTLEYLSLVQNNFNGSFSISSLGNHTRLQVLKLSSYNGICRDRKTELRKKTFY